MKKNYGYDDNYAGYTAIDEYDEYLINRVRNDRRDYLCDDLAFAGIGLTEDELLEYLEEVSA